MEKKKKRVLIVEDEVNVSLLMKESLTDLGPDYAVDTAMSGEEALRKFDRNGWDLVVTDYRMPGISGLQLIETLKNRSPSTLSILITAYGTEEVEQAAQQLKVFKYMTKPFPLADLKRVITDALTEKTENGNGAQEEGPAAPSAVKVTLGGDGYVGKTTMIHRLCTGEFDSNRSMTIGVEFHIHDIQVIESPTRLIVWDVSGQDHFAFTRRAFYRGSKAVGLVYDISNRKSFDRLARWRDEISTFLPGVPIVLAGNKADLNRQVTEEEGRALAKTWGVPFFETTCVSGRGIPDFFRAVAEAAMRSVRLSSKGGHPR
jgi:small GTP-binding protein